MSSDYFGYSVALSGDTLAVGAWGESSKATGVNGDQVDNSARGAGAAYTFLIPTYRLVYPVVIPK